MSTTTDINDPTPIEVPTGRVTRAQMGLIGGESPRHALTDLAAFALLTIFSDRSGICADPGFAIVMAATGLTVPQWEGSLERLLRADAINWNRKRNCWQLALWEDDPVGFAWFTMPSLALAAGTARKYHDDVNNTCRASASCVGAYVLTLLWRQPGPVASTPPVTHELLTSPLAGAPGTRAMGRALTSLGREIKVYSGAVVEPVCSGVMAYRDGRTVEGKREKVRCGKRYAPTRILTVQGAVDVNMDWTVDRNLAKMKDRIMGS